MGHLSWKLGSVGSLGLARATGWLRLAATLLGHRRPPVAAGGSVEAWKEAGGAGGVVAADVAEMVGQHPLLGSDPPAVGQQHEVRDDDRRQPAVERQGGPD